MSIAYLAGLQAKVYKRDQFQKTKDTTVFVWYLMKGFEKIRGLDGGESVNQRSGSVGNFESRSIDFERALLSFSDADSGECDRNFRSGLNGSVPANGGNRSEFYVCIESFRDKEISKKILDTLRLSHHDCSTPATNELAKMYGCKQKVCSPQRYLRSLFLKSTLWG
jgi:hypothetical protein